MSMEAKQTNERTKNKNKKTTIIIIVVVVVVSMKLSADQRDVSRRDTKINKTKQKKKSAITCPGKRRWIKYLKIVFALAISNLGSFYFVSCIIVVLLFKQNGSREVNIDFEVPKTGRDWS